MGNFKKNVIKDLKQGSKKALIFVASVAIVIISLAASYDALVEETSDEVADYTSSNEVKYSTEDNSIVIDDETIDGLIDVIEDVGGGIESLGLSRDDITKLYAAEVVSSEINRGVSEEAGKYYGRVYIKRENPSNGKLETLTYTSLDTLKAMDATQALQYFSIDNGKLCVANTTSNDDGTSTVTINKLDYKDAISKYTMPIEFLLDLCIITQNPEFVLELADKIINETEIVIQVLQDTTTVQTDTNHTYYVATEESKKIEQYTSEEELVVTKTTIEDETVSNDSTTEITTETQTMVSSKIQIQYVKNWIVEATYSYEKVTTSSVDETEVQSLEDEQKGIHEYTYSYTNRNGDYYYKIFTSKITRKVNQTTFDKITITSESYQQQTAENVVDKTSEFIELLKTSYTSGIPIDNLTSGAEMFFNMLQNGERTQSFEQLMRYILGVATNENYGVSDFDFSIYKASSFTTTSTIYGSTTEDKVWYALKELGYSNEAIAGAMGNIYYESGFSTTALNSSSGAYGLAQWKGERRTLLQAYATSKGTTEDDEDTQVEYLIAEITGQGNAAEYATRRTSGGNGENHYTYTEWANATTVEEAAVAYMWFFETPSVSETKTDDILRSESKRSEEGQRYYELYKNRDAGGTYTASSDEYGVNGYYTSSSGRVFTILNQTAISGWSNECNKAACAIIASGYSNESSTDLISGINSASKDLYSVIPGQGNAYWTQYGLDVQSYESKPSAYETKLKNQLISGGYAILWLNNNSSTYTGKSGITWTKLYHWIAVLDYRNIDGTDEICIGDWRGITWVGIDEFETYGIYYMVFVSEN